jgi:integrase
MPRKARERSALEVKRLTQPGLYFVGEVPGLALQVLPSGGRSWILRSVVGNRRRDMGLGGFPEIGLAEARNRAREARNKVRAGIDPIAEAQASRLALRAAAATVLTFKAATEKYIEAHRPSWSNPKHAAQWQSTIEQYAYPYIGELNVADIRMAHILNIFEQSVSLDRDGKVTGKFWETRTETAKRLRGRIESVLDWCKGRGHRSGDNPAAWRGNLEAQLAKPSRIKRVQHHPAVAVADIGAFMTALRDRSGVAAQALEFAILTAARSGEVRGMRWPEVTDDMWTIPAHRMKAKREHRVPLSKAAISVLESVPRFEDTDLVFPAPRGGVLSDMTLTQVMRRMKRTEVPHGFRSTFRDWVAERTGYPSDLAEMALAHTISSAVEAAYRRGDMIDKRRRMMEDWAAFCATPIANASRVLVLRQGDR